MPSRPVRCPSCGASSADASADFGVVIPHRAASENELVGISDDGTMLLGGGDPGVPTEFGRAEIICTCGYQWQTKRGWKNAS